MTNSEPELDLEIDKIRKEVSKLSLRIKDREKPWYREPSVIVAALALLFSFGTTIVSYVRSFQQEVLSARVELRGLIKDIADIPQEHVEMVSKYKNEPLTVSQLSAQLNNKNLSLSNQAAALIDRIESSWYGNGSVLDIDYLTVGTALFNSSQVQKAGPLFDEAYFRARDATTAAGALRAMASVHMASGNVTLMRENYEEAANIYSDGQYGYEPDMIKFATNSTTELYWASAELLLGECENSIAHLENALPMLQLIWDSPLKQQLESQAGEIETNIEQMCRS